jgi:hypothetical protein
MVEAPTGKPVGWARPKRAHLSDSPGKQMDGACGPSESPLRFPYLPILLADCPRIAAWFLNTDPVSPYYSGLNYTYCFCQ